VCSTTGEGYKELRALSKRVAVLLAAAAMAVTMLAAAGMAWAQEVVTPPADPSDLAARAVSSSQIDLNWTDNATDESAYVVERSLDGSTGWTQLGSTLPVDSTSYSDTGLSGSTTYHYRVKATNATGDSGYSNTASATTNVAPPGPSPILNATPDDTWMTNGIVYSVIRHGDYIYVGGKFTRVRSAVTGGKSFAATNLARFRADTGAGDPTWTPDVTGVDMTKVIVYEVAAADGKIWVGGRFGAVDGVARRNLAAVSPDTTGAVDPAIDPVVGTETSIVHTILPSQATPKVYIGGAFGTVDGKGRRNIAAINFSGDVDLAWKPKVDKPAVRSLAFGCGDTPGEISEDTMFATGQFRSAAGSDGIFSPRENIALFNTASGSLNPWAVPAGTVGADEPGLDLAVSCTPGLERVTVPFSGPNILRSFRLDNGDTGSLAWDLKNGGEAQTAAMLGPNKLIIGGHFSQIENVNGGQGIKRERLAQLNLSDGTVDSWNPGASGKDGAAVIGPWDLLVDDNHLYVGGGFYQVGGLVRSNFTRFTFTP
jgi:hypothetical protein